LKLFQFETFSKFYIKDFYKIQNYGYFRYQEPYKKETMCIRWFLHLILGSSKETSIFLYTM